MGARMASASRETIVMRCVRIQPLRHLCSAKVDKLANVSGRVVMNAVSVSALASAPKILVVSVIDSEAADAAERGLV